MSICFIAESEERRVGVGERERERERDNHREKVLDIFDIL
jgi:hypothetical protein